MRLKGVRYGKAQKDRVSILPQHVKAPLQQHLQDVKHLHMHDLETGGGTVYLPYALERFEINEKMLQMLSIQLDLKSLLQAVSLLVAQDQDLGMIVSTYGPPPLWQREEGFHTLIHMILEQQVSLASAQAAYDRLLAETHRLTPENFLRFDDTELKTIGFSRQKIQYGRQLAEALGQGELDLSRLRKLDDVEAKAQLMRVKGIGSWTAEVYLLMALGRPDIWPTGDLALAVAVQQLRQLANRPTAQELVDLSIEWRPWRAVAARILWHFYLSRRQQKVP